MNSERRANTVRPLPAGGTARREPGLRRWSPEEVRALIEELLEAAGLDYDEQVEALGGAFVSEAVRPYWVAGRSAGEAHELLRRGDAEVADMVEALSPVLLGRAEARATARRAVDAAAELLQGRDGR